MNDGSPVRPRFCQANVPGDGTCFFWSIILLFKLVLLEILGECGVDDVLSDILEDGLFDKPLDDLAEDEAFESDNMELLNEAIRERVANYMLADKESHLLTRLSVRQKISIEEYCHSIRTGKRWAGEPEISASSNLLNTLICIIIYEEVSGKPFVYTRFYGETNPVATQCVFVLHDETKKHFSPIYLANSVNSSEQQTIFDRNDPRLPELLSEFIKDKLKYNGKVKLDSISNMGALVSATPPSVKRKAPSIDDVVSPIDGDKPVLEGIFPEYYHPNKRTKASVVTTTIFPEQAGESAMIEQCIQGEHLATAPMKNQHEPADLPVNSGETNQEEKSDAKSTIAGESEDEGSSKQSGLSPSVQ